MHHPYPHYGGGGAPLPPGGGGGEVIRVARRVYVSNLAYKTTWQELKDFMRAAGNGEREEREREREGERSRGIVF